MNGGECSVGGAVSSQATGRVLEPAVVGSVPAVDRMLELVKRPRLAEVESALVGALRVWVVVEAWVVGFPLSVVTYVVDMLLESDIVFIIVGESVLIEVSIAESVS